MSDDRPAGTATYRRKSEVLETEIGDELVTLDVVGGDCFGFNSVAKTVWQCLAGPRSFDQLRDALLAEYDVESERCTMELRELLDDLASRGLIEIQGG